MRLISDPRTVCIVLLFNGIITFGFSRAEEPGIRVSGTVTVASTRIPAEGIHVSVPGYSSAYTDSVGSFTLDVPGAESTIMVTGPGFQAMEIPVKKRTRIDVLLYEEDFISQHETVNRYYDAIPRWLSTHSLATVSNRNKGWSNPGISVEEAFRDKIPGLRTITRSGIPSIGSNLFLRGYSSIYATNQPLVVVDGIIYETKQYGSAIIGGFSSNPMSSLNLNDIEKVTVIRDAASIYGSRAGNGVIYIQTATPSQMETKIDYSMYGGMNEAPEFIPLLGADDYRTYLSEVLQTSPFTADSIMSMSFMIDDPAFPDYYRYHNDKEWQEEVFGRSYNQNIHLKISGGDDIALYALSVGYTRHGGIVKNTDYSRYSFRFNSDINISARLKMFSNLGFTFNQNNLKEDGWTPNTNPMYLSLIKAPFTYPNVRSSDGAISPNLEDYDVLGVSNPSAVIRHLSASSNNYKILGNINLRYRIAEKIHLDNLIGINFDKIRDNLFVPHLGIAKDTLIIGVAENKMGHKVERYFNFYNDFRATFIHSFGWDHHLNALAGVRMAMNTTQGDWGLDYNSPNDQLRSLGSGISSLREIAGYFGDWNWVTWYARADYNFKYKYFLSAGLSLDGSSRFGEEANGIKMFSGVFGVFPSVTAAWLISSEPFLSGIRMLDLMKIRISYGMTGNDDIGNYSSQKYYISQNFLGSQGLVKGNLWNPALQWETNLKFNAGLDISLLEERLFIQADVFSNRTVDMLNIIEADPLSGFSLYIDNDGSFRSTGFEIGLNTRIFNGRFRWDLGLVLSRYRTEVLEFPGGERVTDIFGAGILTREGEAVNLFYGLKTDGVFATQAEADASGLRCLMPNTDLVPYSAGDVRFVDADQNSVIDEDDRQVIGDPNPDFTGMIMNSFSWKNFTLDLGISFSAGNDVYNHLRYRLESMQNANNQTPVVMNRWREEGQVTDIPRASWGDPIGNARFSDRWIEDGSFLRLRYLTLSYNLPVRTGFIRNMGFFVRGNNLFTLTKYLGMNPEFSLSGSPLVQGVDIGLTPQPRSFFVGFNVGL